MRKRDWLIVIFVLSLAIGLTYWQLPETFFQQDEWQQFGSAIYFSSLAGGSILKVVLPIDQLLSHFNPLTNLFFQIEYLFFGISFPPYAITSLVFHLFNTILVFYFGYSLFKEKILALSVGLLFALNSFSHQAVTWIAAGTGLLQSTLFLLLALIFLKNSLLLSLIFLFISLLFKETPIFLFLLLPFYWFLFYKKKKIIEFKKLFLFLFIPVLFYLSVRLFLFFTGMSSAQPEVSDITQPPVQVFLYRFLSIPLRAFSQSIFPAKLILNLAEKIVFLAYPQFVTSDGVANPFVAQTIVADLVSFVLTFLIFIFIFFVFRFLKKKGNFRLGKVLIFSSGFIAAGALPFIFIPGKGGYFSIFEPRNLYILGIGSALMITVLFNYKKWLFLFLAPLLIFHFQNIQKDLKRIRELGQLRKSFLTQIQTSYPNLPDRVIFYTQSDTAYYGLPIEEKILPVQSGFGRMLMVWYQEKEHFPGCLYERQFLHDLVSQGYRECNGRGFGYFRDYEGMIKTLKSDNIPIENVIAFSWESKTGEFKDITAQFRRGKLNND